MSDIVKIPTMVIQYEGLFDFDKLYTSAYKWLTDRKYDVQEPKYKNKTVEIEISWHAKRTVRREIAFIIDVQYHIWGLSKVEAKIDNKIKKIEKARLRIEIKPSIELFPKDTFNFEEWESTSFFIKLKNFTKTNLLKKQIELVYKKNLRADEIHLHQLMKSVLGMEVKEGAY